MESGLVSAMAPVVSKALTSAQLELNAGWQMKQDSMKEEMRAAQDKTLKRVAAMVTQKVDVMVDDVNQVMDVRSETESEDGEGEVTAGVKAKRQKLKPSAYQKQLWAEARHMSEEYNPGDWKNVSVKRLLREYTDHPEAKMFKAHLADGEVALKYDNMKPSEKNFK